MSGLLPIKYKEDFELLKLGISQSSIGYSTITLQSNKYVCVREKIDDKAQLAIIEISNPQNLVKRPITADSAIMNPSHNIVALKSEKNLQVFNLETKQKLSSHIVDTDVTFWKWLSSDNIAFVSGGNVYHWKVSSVGSSTPEKIFTLHQSITNAQIINYHIDLTEKWCVLIGINADAGKIVGAMQLFSIEKNVTQAIAGHSAVFTELQIGDNPHPSNIFIFAVKDDVGAKIHVIEIGSPKPGNQAFGKKFADIILQPDAANDFPLSIHCDKDSGVAFLITKGGYLYLYEIESLTCFYATKISPDVVFVSASTSDYGFIAINRAGKLFNVRLDESNVVNYLKLKNMEHIGIKIAERCGFAGAEGSHLIKFNALFSQGQYEAAAKLAAKSPKGILRTPEIIKRFQNVPPIQNQPSPILHYFGILLESGKLNSYETIELCKPVISQGKKNLIEKWLKEEKLECSDELGDLVKNLDSNIALSIYLRSSSHAKVMQLFAELGQFENIVKYAKKVGVSSDYISILTTVVRVNPEASVEFAKNLVNNDPPLADTNSIVEVFMQYNLMTPCANFLLDALKNNKPEEAGLQTRLLEMTISQAPQVAEAIFSSGILTHYDRSHISLLCERAGLMQRALEHYTDSYDIKRSIVHTHLFNPEWLVSYFGTLSVEDCLSCLSVLLESNLRQNLQICVNVSIKYQQQLSPKALIILFEQVRSFEGLFLFLGGIINNSEDADVHFKYIQAAVKIGQMKEVERICKESNCIEADKVKNFLKEANLADHLPLIIICDRFNFIDEMVMHLSKCNSLKYIELFLNKFNPSRLPQVVGVLLDINCGDDFIRNMIVTVPDSYDMGELVEQVSKRNRMRLLLPVLEHRVMNGNTEANTHSALAMVYIDNNNNPERFLKENQYYDSKVVGKFCEKRNAHLASVAYERGELDQEMITVCVKNGFYKSLARYLVKKKDPALWTQVLDPKNDYRRSLIDQVIQTVLPESQDAEDVSVTVKSFMQNDLPNELVELLEKLILNNTIFSTHRNLQNLLILTSIKAGKSRVMDYVNRLDNYDAPDIANIAIKNEMYEEAFIIFKKFNVHASAISVLIDHIKSLDRAYEYAERVNQISVWSLLGKAQIDNELVKEGINSYIKAGDFKDYMNVVKASKSKQEFSHLKLFLEAARKTLSDAYIDTQYAYTLVQLNELEALEAFLTKSKHVNQVSIGDVCFEDGQYEAAKVIYQNASHFPKLTLAYLKLGELSSAVDCAKKANNVKTWREACYACATAGNFKLAQTCGFNLVVNPDELIDLINFYELNGYINELIAMLESSVGLERAHMGLFTELAITYAKYRPNKLKEHIELYNTRLNIPKVLVASEASHLWAETGFLYEKYEEYDNALNVMMNHPVEAYYESHFRDIAAKVANVELLYKAIDFYIDQHPLQLSDLMILVNARLDAHRVIRVTKEAGEVALIKGYLEFVQKNNTPIVNETLNNIYLEEGLYDELISSVTKYTNTDLIALAQKLENHELIEFRRIANHIYKQCNRWNKSIELAKKDGLDVDAVSYAGESHDPEYALQLLKYFSENHMHDALVVLLYHCYDILKADDVLEYCWKNKMLDYSVPYFVQLLSEVIPIVTEISGKVTESEKKEQVREQPSILMRPQLMIGNDKTSSNFGSGYGGTPNTPFGSSNNYPTRF